MIKVLWATPPKATSGFITLHNLADGQPIALRPESIRMLRNRETFTVVALHETDTGLALSVKETVADILEEIIRAKRAES